MKEPEQYPDERYQIETIRAALYAAPEFSPSALERILAATAGLFRDPDIAVDQAFGIHSKYLAEIMLRADRVQRAKRIPCAICGTSADDHCVDAFGHRIIGAIHFGRVLDNERE